MDLLETVLRTCDSEKYIKNFKDNGIDTFALKILSEEDLKLVGIDDEEKRKKLLENISNLQIPTEKKVNVVVDRTYILLVLNQISVQLHRHYASIIYACKREDIDLCDIHLVPAVGTLQILLDSFEKKVDDLEKMVCSKQNKGLLKVCIPSALLATIGFIIFARYYNIHR
nr:unnamed protein product [Callosobruchus chinensis]